MVFYNILIKKSIVWQKIVTDKGNNCIKKVMINFDKQTAKILMLWSEGYTYAEIAKFLKISVSKVNYEISKALIFLKNQEK